MTMTQNPPRLRTRGRPPKTEADQESLKAQIAEATLRAFAEHGYHQMSVEHILAHAGISRPTFYKYFRQLEEPLAMAAMPLHQDLVNRVSAALALPGDVILNALAAFDAYVDWARSLGPVMKPLYAEFYETSSPIARYRVKTIDALLEVIMAKMEVSGRPKPNAAMLELFVTGVEFLAFRFLLRTDGGEAAWADTRLSMMRLLLSTLGGPQDLPYMQQVWQAGSALT